MRLRALGQLDLDTVDFRRSKALLLLAYLLLEGPTERRRLAELFWPRAANGLNSLAKALSHLRRVVPDHLHFEGARVATTLPCDALDLLRALDDGDEERASALYRGPLFEGVQAQGWSAELEEWFHQSRERLADRLRALQLTRAEAVAAERPDEAVQRAEAAYRLAGAPPPAPQDLARLYRLLLPGASTYLTPLHREAEGYGLTLAELWSTEGPAPAPEGAPPADLPRRETTFIGRMREIAELTTMLNLPKHRLVTLLGAGGEGKTRLALEVARRQAEAGSFRDGVRFVPLASLTDVGSVAPRIAQTLGLPLQGPDAPRVQLVRHLRERRTLMILDNLEQLPAIGDLISELIRSCPQLTVLATSRDRLYLEEEWLYALQGLATPDDDVEQLDEARAYEAMQLFEERARRVDATFALDGTNWRSVRALCRLVAGSPLAIELAAGWANTVDPADLVGALIRDDRFLSARVRNVPERHRSIRATFEHSYALLTDGERAGLSALAIFRGDFTREAAMAVCDLPLAVLASLFDKSLLRGRRGRRFDLHPLVRQYAGEALRSDPATEARVRERHRVYYLERLREWRDSEAYPSPATIAELAADIDDIVAGWRHAVATDRAGIVRAAESLTWYFEVRAQYHEGIEHLAAAAEGLAEVPDSEAARSYVLVARAWLGHWLENRSAEAWAEEGLRYLRIHGPASGTVLGLRVLGIVAWRKGDFPAALHAYREAVDLAREAGLGLEEAIVLDGLGLALSSQGDYDQARRCYTDALALNRSLDNPYQQVHNLTNLSAVTRRMGATDGLPTLAEQALQLAQRIGFRQYIPYCVGELAWSLARLGDHDRAEIAAQEAHALATSIGDTWTQAGSLLLQGRLGIDRGERATARRALERSVALAWSNDDLSLVLRCLYEAARLVDDDRAATWLTQLIDHPATPHWTAEGARRRLSELPQRTTARAATGGAIAPTLRAAFPHAFGPSDAAAER